MKKLTVCFYILMLIASILLNSCRDENDVDDYESGNMIAFTQIHVQDELIQTKAEAVFAEEPHELKDESESKTKLFLHGSQSDGIFFSKGINSREVPQTKAQPVVEMYDKFKVFAQSYKGDKPLVWTPNFMNGIEVLKSKNYTTNKHWPDAGTTISFIAFAPYSDMPLEPSENDPTFSYTVPQDVTGQYDLLFSTQQTTVSEGKHNKVALKFKHVLTAIKFVVGADIKKGTISKITIKNIRGNGKYAPLSNTWTLSEEKFDYSVHDLNKGVTPDDPSTPITLPEQTFMLLPQVTSDDTMVEVEFTDSLTSTKRMLSGSLKNINLQQGKTIVYKISTSNINEETFFDFKWEGEKNTVDYRAEKMLTLKYYSYAKSTYKGDEKESPLNWKVEYSVNGGTTWSASKPDIIQDFQPQGLGSVTEQSLNLKISPSPAITPTALEDNLPVVNFNLSNSSGGDQVENTANCYMIDRAGTYRIPLVYGNGIKNSQVNESAYYNSSYNFFTANQRLWTHTGMEVTDPYIYNTSTGENQEDKDPFDCVLVGATDVPLLFDVRLSDNKKELLFEIKREYIKQGSAVVAVRNKDKTIMWSWHIWITPLKIFTGLEVLKMTNRSGEPVYRKILGLPLGWMNKDFKESFYLSRDLQLKFTQIETGKAIILTANQLNHRIYKRGFALLYQFGRKDPFPSDYGEYELRYYNGYSLDHKPLGQNIELSIQQPDVISNSSRPYRFVNLWDMAYFDYNVANKADVTKTIYDPSPVGYVVPPRFAFNGFIVRNQTEESDPRWVNLSPYVTQDFEQGWVFTSDQGRKLYQLFFPTTGQYNTASTLVDKNVGFYWTAHPNGQREGRSMRLDPTPYIYTYWSGSKERAMGVMPIKEEPEEI